jgi:hypothetical protein
MSTDELVERLRAACIDDQRLARACRLLDEGYRRWRAGGVTHGHALGIVLKDAALAEAVVGADDRLTRATPPWAGRTAREMLLAL